MSLLFFWLPCYKLSINLPPDRLLPGKRAFAVGDEAYYWSSFAANSCGCYLLVIPGVSWRCPSSQSCEHLNDYDLILSESIICLEMEHEGPQAAMSSKRFSLAHFLSPWLKAEDTTATSSWLMCKSYMQFCRGREHIKQFCSRCTSGWLPREDMLG